MSTILILSMGIMVVSVEIVSLKCNSYIQDLIILLKDFKPKVQHGEQDEVDHLLCEAWLVLLPLFLLLGFVTMFKDGSKVELVVAQH